LNAGKITASAILAWSSTSNSLTRNSKLTWLAAPSAPRALPAHQFSCRRGKE
jgi:hypothetical protein